MRPRHNRILTDTMREIRHTFSRFLSLLVLSALAVCFLAGLRATAPDMKMSADRYFDQQRLMDLHILSTLGLTEGDVDALAAQPGVLQAQGAWSVDAIAGLEDSEYIVKVLSYSEEDAINAPALQEGRMPEHAGECLAEPLLMREAGLSIGDTLTLDTGTGTYEDALSVTEVTIVGVADSPLYLGIERGSSTLGTGKVAAYLMMPESAFTMETYTDIYLLMEGGAELLTYSDEYDDLMDGYIDQLEPLGEERARLRGDEVRDEADEALADAEQKLADAEEEVAAELSDAEAELADARRELDDGWAEYYDGLNTFRTEIADAEAELADGEQELSDALTELEDGEREYADAQPDLTEAEQELADAEAELADAKAQLDDAQKQYDAGLAQYLLGMDQYQQGLAQIEATITSTAQSTAAETAAQLAQAGLAQAGILPGNPLYEALYQQAYDQAYAQVYDTVYAQVQAQVYASDAYAQLLAGKEELDVTLVILEASKRELDSGWAEYNEGYADYQDGLREYQDGLAEVQDARRELDDGWQEYYDGLAELEDGRATLEQERADGQRELDDALAELNDGEAEYNDGYQEYLDGKAEAEQELNDARKELEQAQRDVALLDEAEWYILGRNTNAGYASFGMDADRMGNLATVFPLIFFLVAALVCLTTMTRMVEEQRTAIGGLKALGFSRGAIAVKYVGYGFLASAVGALIGLAVGLTLLPWIICTAWSILYAFGDIVFSMEPATSVAACAAAVGVVTLSALAACLSTLTAVPAELMRPKAPPMGKRILLERIGPVWRRLSFNHKITLRNLFRYQKRFWMTVIGIGGCAALIVTAFGLRDSILDVMDKQYDEIYYYTAQVGLVDDVTPQELREVEQLLSDSPLVEDYETCRSETVTAQSGDYSVECYLQTAGSQEELERFVNLRHRTDDTPVVLPDDGAVLTEKLASLLGVEPGDTFTLDGDVRVEVKVADVTEHYIQHWIYLSDAYYEALFGAAPEDNLILVDCPFGESEESEALEAEIVALDGVTSLSLISDTRNTFTSSLESVDYAVVLIIVCAAALAFVVLFNLTNINITERMRELATLKVLGFYDRELSAYVYRENVILTVFGVALGMVLGKLLHQWLILTVEIDLLMFGRYLRLDSYLWAVLLTVLFSLAVNLAAHWKLKKLDMVQSLKSVE